MVRVGMDYSHTNLSGRYDYCLVAGCSVWRPRMNADEYEARCVKEQNRCGRELPRTTDFTGGMPSGYCVAFVVLPVVLIVLAILTGVI